MTDAQAPLKPVRQPSQPILDRLAFEQFTATHRRELKLHCYRMMGSLHEAAPAMPTIECAKSGSFRDAVSGLETTTRASPADSANLA